MRNLEKYKGVIPAFYACYDNEGNVSPEGVQSLTKYFVEKGVKGVYVNGSSGECIYQSVEDRKIILENVMKAAEGKLTVIAHVACNNTKDSQELARHAESLGVDAIAAIPPIYFHLPEYAIAQYWNDISAAAPNTDFVIYNIPQLAGVALTQGLFAEMRKNPNVIGVKNSSMPVQDIQMFKQAAGPDYIIFNGPDEQFMSGRVIGAEGAIGGTYGVMPELYLKLDEYVRAGKMEEAREIQYACDEIIYKMCSAHGNMYAVIKAILKINEGLELGGVKEPLPGLIDEDSDIVTEAEKGGSAILEKVFVIVEKLQGRIQEKASGICISTAGMVNTEQGAIFYSAPLIPNYTGMQFKKLLEDKFKIPCEVENDVNCAGLAEYRSGAAKGSHVALILTIGTGIGGSIIMDGEV